MTNTPDQVVRLVLRLPRQLHRKLVQSAAGDSPPSSLNTEILRRLYETFADRRGLDVDNAHSADVLAKTVQELQERIRELEKKIEGTD